jgi:hypothetical protein
MYCHSMIYSGRYDGAFFVTPSPWTKCYILIHTDPENPFAATFNISSVHQPGYELIWLHDVVYEAYATKPYYVYKPYRPYESSAPN